MERSEENLIIQSGVDVERKFVELSDDRYINTLSIGKASDKPIVLMHGFGMGAATWWMCFPFLNAESLPVRFIDMLGNYYLKINVGRI